MGARRSVIQIVRRHNLVLDSLVIKLDGMLSIIAAENKQILDCELFCLGPSDAQTFLLLFALALKSLSIQQVKHLLVIDLQETRIDVDRLRSL